MRANQGRGRAWSARGRMAVGLYAAPALALLAAFAAVPGARAGGPGPDVIVGYLTDTQTYGTVAGTGLYAYDVGTLSCNVGNVNLRWQAGTPLHPVIAQNIYRLKDGRFEQLGLSWVKHGFFAIEGGFCGACQGPPTNGSALGVGCSDPYDFGLNGTQPGLGPRSEINPSTGIFPFNYAAWPPVVNDLSRRVQIPAIDVDPALNPGTEYFAEAVYVTPDDAQAGNGWNNATYRRMTFGPAPQLRSAFDAGDAAVSQKPAIFAWAAADPGVSIAGVDVPGDGRYFLAARPTDLGNGTWRYQYALYNLSSDRAASALVVGAGAGAGVADASARIVAHHSGEPYSNEPWTTSVGAEGVTFAAPKTFAVEPTTSAVRWATMYTFSFTSTLPPSMGSAGVRLFKPGTGSGAGTNAVNIAIPTPGGGLAEAPAPVNGSCATAQALHAGENRLTVFGAGASGVPASCPGFGADAWFSYTYNAYAPSCPGSVTFTMCAGVAGASMAVYAGPACPAGASDELGCVQSADACAGAGTALSVPAVLGRTYFVRVGLPAGAGGNVVLNVAAPVCIAPTGACCRPTGQCTLTPGAASCFDGVFQAGSTACNPSPCQLPPPPSNDVCSAAIPLGDALLGAPTPRGDNVLASTELFDSCPESQFGQKDVWYVYTPARTETFVADLCMLPPSGEPMDTVLSARAGSCSGPIVACNDDDLPNGCVGVSRISVAATAGTPYYLRVAGYAGTVGEFVVRVRGGGGLPLGVAGACCRGSTCVLSVSRNCQEVGARFAGVGAACNAPGVVTAPCCYADYDQSGAAGLLDIFAFLTDWFAASPKADFGGDASAGPDLLDIFAFLTAWFDGGC